MWKMNKNEAKTDKNKHEIGKRSKAEAGEAKWQKKAQIVNRSPQEFIKVQIWSLVKVWEFGNFSPRTFRKWQKWSLDEIIEEKSKVFLHESKFYKRGPWNKVLIKVNFGPYTFSFYLFGPCQISLYHKYKTPPDLIQYLSNTTPCQAHPTPLAQVYTSPSPK